MAKTFITCNVVKICCFFILTAKIVWNSRTGGVDRRGCQRTMKAKTMNLIMGISRLRSCRRNWDCWLNCLKKSTWSESDPAFWIWQWSPFRRNHRWKCAEIAEAFYRISETSWLKSKLQEIQIQDRLVHRGEPVRVQERQRD